MRLRMREAALATLLTLCWRSELARGQDVRPSLYCNTKAYQMIDYSKRCRCSHMRGAAACTRSPVYTDVGDHGMHALMWETMECMRTCVCPIATASLRVRGARRRNLRHGRRPLLPHRALRHLLGNTGHVHHWMLRGRRHRRRRLCGRSSKSQLPEQQWSRPSAEPHSPQLESTVWLSPLW